MVYIRKGLRQEVQKGWDSASHWNTCRGFRPLHPLRQVLLSQRLYACAREEASQQEVTVHSPRSSSSTALISTGDGCTDNVIDFFHPVYKIFRIERFRAVSTACCSVPARVPYFIQGWGKDCIYFTVVVTPTFFVAVVTSGVHRTWRRAGWELARVTYPSVFAASLIRQLWSPSATHVWAK